LIIFINVIRGIGWAKHASEHYSSSFALTTDKRVDPGGCEWKYTALFSLPLFFSAFML
jgi:hypothetical protein